jgi:hypothetical protein
MKTLPFIIREEQILFNSDGFINSKVSLLELSLLLKIEVVRTFPMTMII